MIGKVAFPYKSMVAEAVMEDDGSWRCDAIPCLVRPLNILHGPTSFEARLDRSRSLCCLASAARWLHGEIRTGETRNEGRSIYPPAYLEDQGALPINAGSDPTGASILLKWPFCSAR
jgi:hypothetical protein